MGGEEFRTVMLEKLGRVLERKDRHSYSGAALDSHGEMMARKLLAAGLEALGLHAEDLSRTRKSDGRKQLLAWLVRRQTTMRNKWIGQELQMGHEINVSRAVSRVARGEDKELRRLKKRVEVAIKRVD